MVRVVGGSKGGLRLKTKDSPDTRATLEKVKEAVFDMISLRVYGAEVLDWFSGNGSLGIEALSRGASGCVFCDRDKECCEIIKSNLTYTGLADKGTVFKCDFTDIPGKIYTLNRRFDIILLDPPYGKDLIIPAIKLSVEKNMVSDRCTIVAETGKDEQLPDELYGFVKYRFRKYGNTAVHIYETGGMKE